MLNLIIFTIFLISSPTFGLLEKLFHTENKCYSGCHSNYADNIFNLNYCKKGCDYRLHSENCADQCKLLSTDPQDQASCLVGCSMNHPEIKRLIENERPRSIILIRLRQGSSLPALSSKSDPIRTFNDIIKQIKENTNLIEQSNELKTVLQLVKDNPVIKSSNDIRTDPSRLTRVYVFQNKVDSLNDRFHKLVANIRCQWNTLLHKQPKLPLFILLTIFILSSAMLWYMIVLLCTHTPRHHNLSIQAEELIIDNTYEKEKLQPTEIKFLNH